MNQELIDKLNSEMLQRQESTSLTKSLHKHIKARTELLMIARREYTAEEPKRMQERIIWFQKKCGIENVVWIGQGKGYRVSEKQYAMTFEEIGICFGITQWKAQDIYNQAIKKLREECIGYGLGNSLLELLEDEIEPMSETANSRSPYDSDS